MTSCCSATGSVIFEFASILQGDITGRAQMPSATLSPNNVALGH